MTEQRAHLIKELQEMNVTIERLIEHLKEDNIKQSKQLKIRRINLLGGPGVGKSTISAKMFAHMKEQNLSVELVREYVKDWAYEGRKINVYDQIYFFGKQLRREYVALSANVDYIITDSPLVLQVMYGVRCGLDDETIKGMLAILNGYNAKYPEINIFLDREGKTYVEEGRYETLEQAKEMDERVKRLLTDWGYPYITVKWNNQEELIETINTAIDLNTNKII